MYDFWIKLRIDFFLQYEMKQSDVYKFKVVIHAMFS